MFKTLLKLFEMAFYGSGSVSVPRNRKKDGYGSRRSVPVRFSVLFFLEPPYPRAHGGEKNFLLPKNCFSCTPLQTFVRLRSGPGPHGPSPSVCAWIYFLTFWRWLLVHEKVIITWIFKIPMTLIVNKKETLASKISDYKEDLRILTDFDIF